MEANAMARILRILLGVVLMVITFAVVGFVLENQQAVVLSFFGWSTGEAPVAVFVVFALIIGMLIGPFLGLFKRSAAPRDLGTAKHL
jgi:lipopolysaccharide assembly protein A